MSALAELSVKPEIVVLAAARAHTGRSAARALAEFDLENHWLEKLDRLGFLLRTASEWRLDPRLRQAVLDNLDRDSGLWRSAHEYYLGTAELDNDGNDVPAYLRLGPGVAYHGSELDAEWGTQAYGDIAQINSLSVSAIALRMADEQSQRGVIDPKDNRILFLRGMTLYREGKVTAATQILREVGSQEFPSRERAIAQHLVAKWDCERGEPYLAESREWFKSSLQWAVSNQDSQHLAHVKHSMALCLLSQGGKNYDRAVSLLRDSLALTQTNEDEWGRAMVLHSLGRALMQQPRHRPEARRLLNASREIGVSLGYRHHVELVDRTLKSKTASAKPRRQRKF
jgi:tetratricopeptide (TPR) repeat protein